MRVCPHCELPALDGSSFCPTCGKPLPAPSSPPSQALMGTYRFPPGAPARAGTPSAPPVSPFGATMPVAVIAAPGSAPPVKAESAPSTGTGVTGSASSGAAGAAGTGAVRPTSLGTSAGAAPSAGQGSAASGPPASPAHSASATASQSAAQTGPGAPAGSAGSTGTYGGSRPIVTNLGPAVKASPPRLASSAAISPPPPFASVPMAPAASAAHPPPAAPPAGSPEVIAAGHLAPSSYAGSSSLSGSSSYSGEMTKDSIAIPDPRNALLGVVVDGFSIDSILGSGGCGTVYRGRQLGLDRPVAIKVPTFDVVDDPVLKKRFLREARAAARVKHPSVVTIYGVGEVPDGRPYLAMELLDGVSLMQVLDDGPLEVDRALALARQIALALAETHAAGVVHRDLKPSNIIWRRDRSGGDRITIVDFGIAAGQQGSADATRLTAGGKVIGTPHYMAPEQAQGEHEDINHRSDLYALGCVLFELLTAEVPFDGTGFEVVLAHMTRQPEPPSARLPGIPPEVDALVLQLMSKRPNERPGSAEEVIARIDSLRAQLSARPSHPANARAGRESQPAHALMGREIGERESAPVPAIPGPPPDASTVGAASTMLAPGAVGPARGAQSLSQLERGSRPNLGAPQHAMGQHGSQPNPGGHPPHPMGGHGRPSASVPQPPMGAHGSSPGTGNALGQHGPQGHQGPQGHHGQQAPRRPTHTLSSAALARRRQSRRRLAMVAIAVCAVAALTGVTLQRLLRDDGKGSPAVGAPEPGTPGTKAPETPGTKPPETPGTPATPGPSTEQPNKPPPSWDSKEPRVVMIDSGDLSMRMEMPGRLAVEQSAKVTLEIWDGEGEPLAVPKVLITIEPPGGGQPVGFEAKLKKRGVYEFAQAFAQAGRNIVRVFPESTDATFEVDLDVVEGG